MYLPLERNWMDVIEGDSLDLVMGRRQQARAGQNSRTQEVTNSGIQKKKPPEINAEAPRRGDAEKKNNKIKMKKSDPVFSATLRLRVSALNSSPILFLIS